MQPAFVSAHPPPLERTREELPGGGVAQIRPTQLQVSCEQRPGGDADFSFGRSADEIDIDEDFGDFDELVEQVSTIGDQEMITRVADGFPHGEAEGSGPQEETEALRLRKEPSGDASRAIPSMYEKRDDLREFVSRSEGGTYAMVRRKDEALWREEAGSPPPPSDEPLVFQQEEDNLQSGRPKGRMNRRKKARSWLDNLSLGPPSYWEDRNGALSVPAHRETEDDNAESDFPENDDWWELESKEEFAPGYGSERHIRVWAADDAEEGEGADAAGVPPCMCRDRTAHPKALADPAKAVEEAHGPHLHCNGRPGCKNRAEGPRFARYDDRLDDNGGEASGRAGGRAGEPDGSMKGPGGRRESGCPVQRGSVIVYSTAPPKEGARDAPAPAWVPPPQDRFAATDADKTPSFKPERWLF
eukprot:tig00021072_g17986.t1